MTPENFTYWLQGFVELDGDRPTEFQWQEIKNHLALVFNKVVPKVNQRYCSYQNVAPDIHYLDPANTENAQKEVKWSNSSFYDPQAISETLSCLAKEDLDKVNKAFSC